MPTPDIDIGELRRLEKAVTADPSLGHLFTMTNAEWDYWTALRNAAPALLAKWEECDELKRKLALAEAVIATTQKFTGSQQITSEEWNAFCDALSTYERNPQ